MFVEIMPSVLLVVAWGLAILALIQTPAAEARPYGRGSFAVLLALVSLPYLAAVADDIAVMEHGRRFLGERFMDLLFVFNVIVAYPFFRRVCWRAADSGASRALCWVALVPYLNVLVFLYLCLKPGRTPVPPLAA